MARRSTSSTKHFNPKSPLAVALFVLIFGIVGAAVLSITKAATESSQQIYAVVTDYATAQAADPSVKVVQDSVSYTAQGVQQNVVQLTGTQEANFQARKGGGTVTPVRTCYYLRAVDAPATVVITSGSNRNTVTLTGSYYYQKKCLQYGTGDAKRFSVQHVSGAPVNVYQQVTELTQ